MNIISTNKSFIYVESFSDHPTDKQFKMNSVIYKITKRRKWELKWNDFQRSRICVKMHSMKKKDLHVEGISCKICINRACGNPTQILQTEKEFLLLRYVHDIFLLMIKI